MEPQRIHQTPEGPVEPRRVRWNLGGSTGPSLVSCWPSRPAGFQWGTISVWPQRGTFCSLLFGPTFFIITWVSYYIPPCGGIYRNSALIGIDLMSDKWEFHLLNLWVSNTDPYVVVHHGVASDSMYMCDLCVISILINTNSVGCTMSHYDIYFYFVCA